MKRKSENTEIKQTTTKELSNEQSKRVKKIEKINSFLNNPTFTDKDGISYDLRVENNEINRRKMYESEKINYKSRYDDMFIIVSAYQVEEEFELYSNGDLKDVIKVKGYLLESKRSDRNDYGQYCSDTFIFYPELNTEETKKSRIADFTGVNCGMGKEINNKVKNERIKAVKTSGILNNQEIKPFVKSKPTPTKSTVKNTEKPKASTIKITVDNLRVRTSPNLDAEKIENLAINTEVVFLNEKSNEKTSVTIENEEIEEFWYKIKTPSGNIGWIHGCCFENN